jgi:uncharacterized membrane protein
MNKPNTATSIVSGHHDPRIRRLELIISALLRFGVATSVILIVIGTVTIFVQHPAYLSSSDEMEHLVGPNAAFPHALDVLATGLHQWRGESVVTLGLLILMITPVARVAVSMLAFVWQRDRTYTLLTAAVLCLLLLSLVLGRAE